MEVQVEVEVPSGGRIKRRPDGSVDFVSPFATPFNYGCVPGLVGGDGDPLDMVLLGPRRPRGHREVTRVWATVRFVDAGDRDDKLVCAAHEPTGLELQRVLAFFERYARLKGLLNRARGLRGDTRLDGWVPGAPDLEAPPDTVGSTLA